MKKLLMLLVALSVLNGCTVQDGNITEDPTPETNNESANEELAPPDEHASEEQQADYEIEMALIEADEENKLQADVDLANEILDGEDKKVAGGSARGSCDAIAEGSTCLEYYGSFWTEQQMKLNCSDSGTFSLKGCPKDWKGGCNTGNGTQADMVAWMYTRGGGGITEESLGYAKMACDATMASKWLISR